MSEVETRSPGAKTGESSYNKLIKAKTPRYIYETYCLDPPLAIGWNNGVLGSKDRWYTAIPRGARIACDGRDVPYCGNGKVMDGDVARSVSDWCQIVKEGKKTRYPNTVPPMTTYSGPMLCSVVLSESGVLHNVPLKFFDFVYVERLAGGPLQWVLMDISPPAAAEGAEEFMVSDDDDDEDGQEEPAAVRVKRPLESPPSAPARRPYPVAFDATGATAKKLKKASRRTLANTVYGFVASAMCIMCNAFELFLDRPETCMGHLVSECNGGRSDKTYNLIHICHGCNNSAGKHLNLFDQCALHDRLDVVVTICEKMLQVYCRSEADVDYQFTGRLDFVQRVYGVNKGDEYGAMDSVPGGVRSKRVLQVLRMADETDPLDSYMLNPLKRAVFCRTHY